MFRGPCFHTKFSYPVFRPPLRNMCFLCCFPASCQHLLGSVLRSTECPLLPRGLGKKKEKRRNTTKKGERSMKKEEEETNYRRRRRKKEERRRRRQIRKHIRRLRRTRPLVRNLICHNVWSKSYLSYYLGSNSIAMSIW